MFGNVTSLPQPFEDEAGDITIVFNDENSHCISPAVPPGVARLSLELAHSGLPCEPSRLLNCLVLLLPQP
jgi:hypothetical protein